MDYDEPECSERQVENIEECFPFKEKSSVTWVNINGLHEVDILKKLGKHFNIHSLVLEDILNTSQRPKAEELEGYIFIVLRMLSYNGENSEIKGEQISLILGENYIISFLEGETDIFYPIRERIRTRGKGRIRKMGSDYLAYALIDAVVDHYFLALEKIGEKIEGLEDELISNPKPEMLQSIHDLKSDMIFIRKSIWPLREVISSLVRGKFTLIKESTGIFLRDVYDHTIQVIDTVESFRDMLSGMLDIYLSSISNKMNEVMKVLTIIATIFIPLTFIAGIYGMNFENMPELKVSWGYFAVWGLMIVVGGAMVSYFRKKRWL